MAPGTASTKKHLAVCSIPKCKQQISENCSLHVFPNERDPRRKQWIKVLKVERDVPRHFRICSKHFKSSDFFPRHQMQKKLMLRPTAVPTENLPSDMTEMCFDRSESPENTSSSFVSLDQSDSSTATGNMTTSQVMTVTNSSNNINNNTSISNNIIINNNNNNNITSINNNNVAHQSEYQDEVKLAENFSYHPSSTTLVQATTISSPNNFQSPSYETLTPLSTVPYQEITEEPMYMLSDGTEIDRTRLSNILNKDDYGGDNGTITYVVNFIDY